MMILTMSRTERKATENDMDWDGALRAVDGRSEAIVGILHHGGDHDAAALTSLLLSDEAPHGSATLVAAASLPAPIAPPIHAALAPLLAPALAVWRADPQWPVRTVDEKVRRRLTGTAVRMIGALRGHPDAQRNAVAIALRDGDSWDVERCLEALGADGWAMLDDDLRGALLARADAAALGRVWGALTEAQRKAAVRAATRPNVAAGLIGRIGAVAWSATDPALRTRLIRRIVRAPTEIAWAAPAWPGMTDDERARLIAAVIAQRRGAGARLLINALGPAGRASLTAAQRAALDARAMEADALSVFALRAADAGWDALPAEERSAVLAAAEAAPWRAPLLLRAVGVAGWRALCDDDRRRIAAVVQWSLEDALACPPTLWTDLAGADLPRATEIPDDAIAHWRPEDADADLSRLPPAHQTLVLALAPWRRKDAAADSARMQRLRAAWSALPDDERVALATRRPFVLATVAAAARLRGGAAATVDAVGATVARLAAATDGAAAARVVGAMLHDPDRWRPWMDVFAPSAADPPEAWAAWRVAAQRGIIADLALCARLAAKRRATPPSAL